MYLSQSLRSATSPISNFQRFAGSFSRARKRWRCSSLDTCRKNLRINTPLRARCCSNFRILLKRSSQISLLTSDLGSRWRSRYSGCTRTTSTSSCANGEDADPPALRQRLGDAPQEVVIELLMARRLEGMHLTALRVDAGHHVLDCAVLAGGVHRLEDRQHRPPVLRVELLLQGSEALHAVREHCLGFALVDIEAAGVGGVIVGEPEFVRLVDAETAQGFGERHNRIPRRWRQSGKPLGHAALEKCRDKRRHRRPQITQPTNDVDVRKLRLLLT